MYFLGKPVYEWIYIFISTCAGTFLVVFPYFMLNSCKIMHKLKDGNRRGLCTLAGMFFPIGIIVATIVKIIDKIKYKEEYAKDKIEKYEKAHISTGANIELVYCPECGKAYAKGEEPCMCKCGYIFSRPKIK